MSKIDQVAETNRIANSLSTVNLAGSDGKKNSEEIQNIQAGITKMGTALGSFIPGFGAVCSIASAVLGGIAAVFGS